MKKKRRRVENCKMLKFNNFKMILFSAMSKMRHTKARRQEFSIHSLSSFILQTHSFNMYTNKTKEGGQKMSNKYILSTNFVFWCSVVVSGHSKDIKISQPNLFC